MRFIAISDTHGMHKQIQVPECDVLMHAGDFTATGTRSQTAEFLDWFAEQPARFKVVIPGNHDWYCYKKPDRVTWEAQDDHGIFVLIDDYVDILGVRIYGYPWTPKFGHWAFMGNQIELKFNTQRIPDNTNIILSHGPPYGLCDQVEFWDTDPNQGCHSLLARVMEIKPQFVVCGHLHEAYGMKQFGETFVINASTCNFDYEPVNAPIAFTY